MKSNIRLALAAAVSLVALDASAGGFAVREQSTTAQGTSFAGAATSASGLSSMYWNPAAVTSMPGITFESHAALVLGFAKMTPGVGSGPLVFTDPDTGNIAQPALVPATYSSYQVTDRLFVGLSINSPFGLVTKSNTYSAAQLYGRSSKAFNVVGTPTVGYIVNDWLSVAAGLQIGYINVSLKQAQPLGATAAALIAATGPAAVTSDLSGDAWGVGYTLGATIKPWQGGEIGIGFRSSMNYELKGTFAIVPPIPTQQIKAKLNTPEILTIGLRQQINQQFTVLLGYEWTNWSRLGSPAVVNRTTGLPISKLGFEYKDSWMVSLGGEYKWNENLTLRTGFAYEKSPIADSVRSVRIPDNDRIWASLGASYQLNNSLSFDVAYTHIFVKNPNVNIVSGNPNFINPAANLVASGKAHVDIISLGLRYRFGEPPVRPAAVTKG